ncbi:MAG TPA: nuclear transport factor 2 family protein [Burkholderiaceae bacterium]|nr:nuclear transport factor 2 family protein [Burkholderiaceae bacterium]
MPTEVIQAMYAAFGRGDVAALLEMLSDDVEWTHHGDIGLAYMGTFKGKNEVARWFGHVAALDAIEAFEPREFLAGADHVTVLGWERTKALPAGRVFETDWVHVFKVRDGKVTHYIGMYDTAASARARA